jgi:hypothetical protein
MSIAQYRFTAEPRGEQYRHLLEWACECSSAVGVITYPGRSTRDAAVLDELAPWIAEETTVTAWPGSRLGAGYQAVRMLYEYRTEVMAVMLRHSEGLFDWRHPFLPDDPHWFRADGSLWLGTTTHEGRAWLELSEPEASALARKDVLLQLTCLVGPA